MSLARPTLLYLFAAALGVFTLIAIGEQWLPPGLVAVSFATFFILVLPREPRFVAAFCAGAALAVFVSLVAWFIAS